MVTICVSSKKICVQTICGTILRVFDATVQRNGMIARLNDIPSFEQVREVEIIRKNCVIDTDILINDGLQHALCTFLNTYHLKPDLAFDCYAFANLTNNVEEHKVKYLRAFWKIRKCAWLRSGDTVFLISKDASHFQHAAIYLGFGLFVSVYGAGGDLEFSTLKDMRRDYGADTVVYAEPIRRSD